MIQKRDMRDASAGVDVVSYNDSTHFQNFMDEVTVEEPLEVRVRGKSEHDAKTVSVIMRTPGMDRELAAGFLYTEGIVSERSDILGVEHTYEGEGRSGNVVVVTVTDNILSRITGYGRNFTMNSSCGVCGKSSINEVFVRSGKLVHSHMEIDASIITSLPGKMKTAQKVFSKTGGVHAAGLFDVSGKLVILAEDIGRHNAVDKIIGSMFLENALPATDYILQTSGRAGFEIVQKAAVAGIPIISSVSAPSSLAIETARSFNATLVCFVRDGRFNIYANPQRIIAPK